MRPSLAEISKTPRYAFNAEVLTYHCSVNDFQHYRSVSLFDTHFLVSIKCMCFFCRSIAIPKDQYQRHQAFLNLSMRLFHKHQMVEFGMKYFGTDSYFEVTSLISKSGTCYFRTSVFFIIYSKN